MVKYAISEWSSLLVYITFAVQCILVRLLPVHVFSYPQIDLYQINLRSQEGKKDVQVDEIVFLSSKDFFWSEWTLDVKMDLIISYS